jgi:hypothetical protein
MHDVTITPIDNGPYIGGATLRDAEGNAYEVGDTIALCRWALEHREALRAR